MLEAALLIIFPLLVAYAAADDLLRYKISNNLVMLLGAAFFPVALLAGFSPMLIGTHLLCGALSLIIGIFLFSRGYIGGGDAKLFAAIGLWFGFSLMPAFVLITGVFGGVLALALLSFRNMSLPPMAYAHNFILRLHEPKGGIPYGIALSAAGFAVYPYSALWQSL